MQQSNSPNSRNGFSIIAQLVSHLLTRWIHESIYTLFKRSFLKTSYFLLYINILFQNTSPVFSPPIEPLRSISTDISARISIPSLYMWRIRQTWTEWESPWHAYGHALFPRFSLPDYYYRYDRPSFSTFAIHTHTRTRYNGPPVPDVIEKHDEPSRLVTWR